MNFGRNFLFDLVPFVFGIIGLVFYIGIFALIVLGVIFLYKKIQNETQIYRISKDIKEIKLVLKNMKEVTKEDSNDK